MNTMTEQDIRARLRDALGSIEPAAAPARAIASQGRRIRWERRGGAVAVLAVLVAVGTALPGLHLTTRTGATTPAAGGLVQVSKPPPASVEKGVIATGRTEGQRWTITLTREHGIVAAAPGVTAVLANAPGRDPVRFGSGYGGPGGRLLMSVGGVRRDVTSVTVKLSSGTLVHLSPVRWDGKLWVSLVLPRLPVITSIVAYGRAGELSHAVPYTPDSLNGFRVLKWLAPGQSGPARSSTRLPFLLAGAGARSHVKGPVVVRDGPWGRCITSGDKQSAPLCDPLAAQKLQPGQTLADVDCGGNPAYQGNPEYTYCVVQAAPQVSRIRIRLSNGSVHNIRPVMAGSSRYLAFLLSQVKVVRWTTFDAAGHQLGTGASL
jgi:hypothetical protein